MVSIVLSCCQNRLFCRFTCEECCHPAYEATVEDAGCHMLAAHTGVARFCELLTPRSCIYWLLCMVDSVTVIVGEWNMCQVYGCHSIPPELMAKHGSSLKFGMTHVAHVESRS